MAYRWSLVALSKWPSLDKRPMEEGGTTFGYSAAVLKTVNAVAAELRGDNLPVKVAQEGAEWVTVLGIISTYSNHNDYLRKQLQEMRETIDEYLQLLAAPDGSGSLSLLEEAQVIDPSNLKHGKEPSSNGRPH